MTIVQNSANAFKRTLQGSGVVDANGNCTITIPAPSLGTIATGSITIYDSPPTVIWMKFLNEQVVDTVVGQSTCGNIQMGGSEKVKFVASGLTGYVGTVFHATFFAIISPESDTNLVIPGHDSLQPAGIAPRIVFGPAVNVTATGRTVQVFLLPTDQSIWIGVATGSGPATFTVTGNVTGVVYMVAYKLFGGQSIACPAYGIIDTSVTVQITHVPANAIITIAALADNEQIGSPAQNNATTDGNGPCQYQVLVVAAGTGAVLLPTPAADLMYIIYNIAMQADTTVDSAPAHIRVAAATNDVTIVGGNARVFGFRLMWTGFLPIQDQINAINLSGVAASYNIFYNTVPASS